MKKNLIIGSVIIILTIILFGCFKTTADWPQWRGPNRDNISTETGWNAEALNDGVNTLWTAQIGTGYSAPAIKGNRLYIMGNALSISGEDSTYQDNIFCFHPVTGKEIWKHTYPCPEGRWPGPRATPTAEGNRIYTLSREGQVFCLNAATGAVVWERNLFSDSLAIDPDFGLSGSPIIHDNLLIFNAGKAGLALDKTTGEPVWYSELGKNGFASPVLYTREGATKAAIFSRLELYSVNAETGDIDWMLPWKTPYEENVADPIVLGDRMFISTGYKRGCALLDISGDQAEIIWENKNMSNHFTSAILMDGKLYGIDGVARKECLLKCMDFMTGDILWEEPFEFGAVTGAADKLIILTETGVLHVVTADPGMYTPIASAKVIDQHEFVKGMPWFKFCASWTPPVLCDGLIYVRNNYGDFVCVDVR